MLGRGARALFGTTWVLGNCRAGCVDLQEKVCIIARHTTLGTRNRRVVSLVLGKCRVSMSGNPAVNRTVHAGPPFFPITPIVPPSPLVPLVSL